MLLISGKFARQMAMAMEIPLSPIAGGWMGYYIDEYFKTQLWFTIILAFLGFVHAILTIIRIAKALPPRSDN